MKIKRCAVCQQDKKTDRFNKNKSRKDGLNTVCRECSRARSKQYYNENKKKHKLVVTERKKAVIAKNKKRLLLIKQEGCSYCDESEPCCMDFHHTKPSIKHKSVSTMVNEGCSWQRIEQEIAKCVMLCANCHRKVHNGIIRLSGVTVA